MCTPRTAGPWGRPPSLSDTRHIGYSAASNRNWNGLMDDLRVYDRLLTYIEIHTLAPAPSATLAPIVSAGANQIIVFPATVNLNSTVTDDGNPNPLAAVTVAWKQISGPGTVIFADSNDSSTCANLPAAGVYVLQHIADDSQAP